MKNYKSCGEVLKKGLQAMLLSFLFISTPTLAQVVDDLPTEPHARQAAECINKAYDYDFFFPFKEDDKMHLTPEQKLDSRPEKAAQGGAHTIQSSQRPG